MVNGNYVLYGDRPSSESEIVNDHVQTRTAERKNKRKFNRNANELQRTLSMAQLDNETDAVKYEKKIKEPKLLRYVPTTDVKENYVTEKFETYDLKSDDRPRRYGFQKKPRNPTDGSVNYAYSRSSSGCSSPNTNLPTISEHGEQYGTYRVQPLPNCAIGDIMNGYEKKMDKYFTKPKDANNYAAKGSHPDSLYRVQTNTGGGADNMMRVMRVLRWPVALIAVCIALAVFVYFLMPENIESRADNSTNWEPITARAHTHASKKYGPAQHKHRMHNNKPETTNTPKPGTKTPEIDFYEAETERNVEFTSISESGEIKESNSHRVLPINPVYPAYIAPEVQYGNEKGDTVKLRNSKLLKQSSSLPDDSTLKPHITHKPEKPLAVYFRGLNEAPVTETITIAETGNEFPKFGDKQNFEIPIKSNTQKENQNPAKFKQNFKQYLVEEPELPQEIKDFYSPPLANFTSGHSKLFGISIEDAEKMQSTTQNYLYNTRVSPTLPTWRDGDDSTTKKYPINVNYEVPQCRSTRLGLCRGVLPYDLAGAPVMGFEADPLLSDLEQLVATNCSQRLRQFACALLEPECNPPGYPPKMPCYSLCKAISDSCYGQIPDQLLLMFSCKRYPIHECVSARVPCGDRELACGDGNCVPRDWMCDGNNDCSNGEDELHCSECDKTDFQCASGGCILKRWLCDGYADCPRGEDEIGCSPRDISEPGEEAAGSAPAPAVRRPNRVPPPPTRTDDNSKELLVTSDSSSALKRNYTRRPSSSRLTPYSHPPPQQPTVTQQETAKSIEDINLDDLGFFDDTKKVEDKPHKPPQHSRKHERPARKPSSRAPSPRAQVAPSPVAEPTPAAASSSATKLDKSINNLEKVINGAALMRKAEEQDSPETNATTVERNDDMLGDIPPSEMSIPGSSHLSPCPSGELRCVDGRCITLAQLCDGTIDCTDHADEDNCYT